jgi:hypothetical protein
MPLDDVVKIKMTQSPPFADGDAPVGDDLVWVWDVSTGILRQAAVSSLPFTGGGGGGGGTTTLQASPFMITNDMAAYSYDAPTDSITIKDVRLLNKSFYPVSTTQFGGGDLRLSQLTYQPVSDDPTKGMLVIAGFQLNDGEHITITIPGSGSSADPVYNQLLADVVELKRMLAPFTPTALGANGGKVWWPSANAIPPGWVECVAMRGLMPIGKDGTQADFNAIGNSGGAKSVKLAANNIPELSTTIQRPLKFEDVDRGTNGGHSNWSLDNIETITVKVGTADAGLQKVNTISPYMTGIWIEYIGI